MLQNTEVAQRSLTLPPSIMRATLPVGAVKWRRTIVAGEDVQELAHTVAIASGDDVTKVELMAPGAVDFPLYIKRECDIVFPSGSVELLGIVVSPDMLEDEYDLWLELDGHHITPSFIGRLIATMGTIPSVVREDWALLNEYVPLSVSAAYAERHGWPASSAVQNRRKHPRTNDPNMAKRIGANHMICRPGGWGGWGKPEQQS